MKRSINFIISFIINFTIISLIWVGVSVFGMASAYAVTLCDDNNNSFICNSKHTTPNGIPIVIHLRQVGIPSGYQLKFKYFNADYMDSGSNDFWDPSKTSTAGGLSIGKCFSGITKNSKTFGLSDLKNDGYLNADPGYDAFCVVGLVLNLDSGYKYLQDGDLGQYSPQFLQHSSQVAIHNLVANNLSNGVNKDPLAFVPGSNFKTYLTGDQDSTKTMSFLYTHALFFKNKHDDNDVKAVRYVPDKGTGSGSEVIYNLSPTNSIKGFSIGSFTVTLTNSKGGNSMTLGTLQLYSGSSDNNDNDLYYAGASGIPFFKQIHANFVYATDATNLKVMSGITRENPWKPGDTTAIPKNNSSAANGWGVNVLVACTNPDSSNGDVGCDVSNFPEPKK